MKDEMIGCLVLDGDHGWQDVYIQWILSSYWMEMPKDNLKQLGLRQGDPPSSFLFTIAANIISRMLIKAKETGILEGFQVGRTRLGCHMCNLQMILSSSPMPVKSSCKSKANFINF